MIRNVSLSNISSYSPATTVVFGPLKRINLVYGLNGSGKSTIGNFLQSRDLPAFRNCSLDEDSGELDICVYNQSFIEKNFHGGSQPGVFTLNQGNIEAEQALLAAEEKIKELDVIEKEEMQSGSDAKRAQVALEDALKEGVWALRKQVESTPLRYCLQGPNTKDRLIEKILAMEFLETNDKLEELSSEADDLLKANDQPRPSIRRLVLDAQRIEGATLFQEQITASDESYLSALILALGNSDWVKHSLNFINESTEQCPLCQQKLPEDFYRHLRKVFDTTYEERIRVLESLRGQYTHSAVGLISQIDSSTYPNAKLTQLTSELKAVLIENIRLIEDKLRTPSIAVTLVSSTDLIVQINELISVEQVGIDTFNAKLRDKSRHLELITNRFWVWFRSACDELLKESQQEITNYKVAREVKRDAVLGIRRQKEQQRQVMAQSRMQITNIDQAIGNINSWLTVLGLQGFQLTREDGEVPQYRLQRSDESQDKVFKSLSEGEKTLISFLYFLEVCNGELDAESTKQKSDRIVVIDDPISSLSHNYVYDVASLIRQNVLLPAIRFKQVIVLTHNLFFFHELVKLTEDDNVAGETTLFKVSKAAHSGIQSLRKEDIRNDYHAFWHTIKDALGGRASSVVVPNMMRNILEYYFSFIHRKDRLRKALDDLSTQHPEFRALYRYINRESHSDAVNLTEFGEINAHQFVEQFRRVFVETGNEEHFERMMTIA